MIDNRFLTPWDAGWDGPDHTTETLPNGTRVDTFTYTGPPFGGTLTMDWNVQGPTVPNDGSVAGAVRVALARNRRK